MFRGPDILRNVIVLCYVTFYRIKKCFINILFFIIDKTASRLGWNDFAGRIWSAGRSLETPAL